VALATRELELVIIARDRASATLARVGGALAILGAGASRLGAKGVGLFASATKEAIEFRRNIALAFTQVEVAGATFDDVLELVRESAKKTAVPIEELTESTFDIFSTLTLDTMGQASELLDEFAKSAVSGQAPIRDIGRATIAWLNALNLAPTAKNAARILDIQFELVRKGAGTYTEFATVMGKAIPPFVAANQTAETMAASLAFLTRNGLSAAEAATSASRAVELLFGPKAVVGLRKVGIELVNEEGRFRSIRDMMTDIVPLFQKLDDAERKLKFKEIFGQGRIQARRFFDLILAEGNFEEFLFLLDEVEASPGAVAEAFKIMMDQPAIQLEVLTNRFRVLRDEIGDVFIPFLTTRVIPVMDKILKIWEDLDDIQRENILKWSAFATIFLTVGGALTGIVGAFILIIALLKVFTGSALIAGIAAGSVALVISTIAAAIALAIIDWDKFVEIFGPWWDKILDKMQPVVDWLERIWPAAWEGAKDAYQSALDWFEDDWPVIWEGFKSGIEDWLENDWPVIWGNAETAIGGFVAFFVDLWDNKLRQPLIDFWGWIVERWDLIWGDLKGFFEDFVSADWGPLWDEIKGEVEDVLPEIEELLISLGRLFIAIFGVIVAVVGFIWKNFGDEIIESVRILVNIIGGFAEFLLLTVTGFADIITGILTLDPGLVLAGAEKLDEAVVVGIVTTFETIRDEAILTKDVIESALKIPGDPLVRNLKEGAGDLNRFLATVDRNALEKLLGPEDFKFLEEFLGPVDRSILDFLFPEKVKEEKVTALKQSAIDDLNRILDEVEQSVQPRTIESFIKVRIIPQFLEEDILSGLMPSPILSQFNADTGGQFVSRENQPGGRVNMNIENFNTNADPEQVASDLAWRLNVGKIGAE